MREKSEEYNLESYILQGHNIKIQLKIFFIKHCILGKVIRKLNDGLITKFGGLSLDEKIQLLYAPKTSRLKHMVQLHEFTIRCEKYLE